MKHIVMGAAALVCTTSMVSAEGLDRSGQSVAPLFEKGTYGEMSFGSVDPNQSGTFSITGAESGDMAGEFKQLGAALKWDLSPQVSMAIIYDQPFGAKVVYERGTSYPLTGTEAHMTSVGVTALMRYKFNENFSMHGGLRYISLNNDISLPTIPGGYSVIGADASGTGYVIGAAYEKPEIALRAALTYSSEIDIDQDIVEIYGGGNVQRGSTSYKLPQSVNLDLQSGVAPGTLVFANIRWADWTAVVIDPPNYAPATPLLEYSEDGWTYTIGVARQFNEKFAGSLALGYEAGTDGNATNLSPSDGMVSLTVGGKYQMTEQVALSGGVTYQRRGDATTDIGIFNGEFDDNSLTAVGLKISYNF